MMIPTPINKINHFTTAVKIGPWINWFQPWKKAKCFLNAFLAYKYEPPYSFGNSFPNLENTNTTASEINPVNKNIINP